jgi:hypothetical protein
MGSRELAKIKSPGRRSNFADAHDYERQGVSGHAAASPPRSAKLQGKKHTFYKQHHTYHNAALCNTEEMDTSKVLSLLEQLDGEIDDLEESLAPLVTTALSETASKLPLLDKAKLYVLVTYAIESILFCECHALLSIILPNKPCSLSATARHQSARTSCFHRTHTCEAIF